MNAVDIIVILAAMAALAGLGWFFFGPRKARAAVLAGGMQRLEVTVKGGYSPEVIRVRQGVPVELTFDRQESGDCTARVVFPDFRVSAALPAYQRTTVRLDPGEAGEFGFACGMNMIHGTLLVEPAAGGTAANSVASGGEDQAGAAAGSAVTAQADGAPPGAARGWASRDAGDAEAAERQAEIADLARRVIAGAVLTLPVLYAVVAHDLFKVWVPAVLLNHWVQLALITPVMFYT